MKNLKLVSLVLVFILMSISCKLFTPGSTKNTSNVPTIDFAAVADPLNVTVTLDAVSTTSATISPNGGSLSLTAADGSVYNLEIPAKALDADTLITMTAVKNIDGAPLDSGKVSAVQLEPSGQFFNEILTLTITPAKEIPIQNQVIFNYEGNGQDYHLAVVDPKSKDIKILLMEFSGAGVGFGSDSAWAANLQIQGNATAARLAQKTGELLQQERRAALMGAEGNPDAWKIIKSDMEQYYDQVIQKEMAAAELDCQYARRAIQDLLGLERQNQLLGITPEDSNGNRPPFVNDLSGKINKLVKIGEKCKKAYTVSGDSNGVSFSGMICGLDKSFVIDATFPGGGNAKTTFTPITAVNGTTKVEGGGDECVQTGAGTYDVSITADSASITWTTTDTLTCPEISNTQTGTFTLPLQPAPEGSCP